MTFEEMRRQYRQRGLDERDLAASPVVQFQAWFDEACQDELPSWFETNAVSLATCDSSMDVTCRTVLLKSCDEEGFIFFSNYRSRKGQQLAENPRAALLFYWPQLERQVRINGTVSRLDRATSTAYFHRRPRGSQVGAAASAQSQPIVSRAALEQNFAEYSASLGDAVVPLPDQWGGYLLVPDRCEFWQGRDNRLHDRLVYQRDGDTWRVERLQP